MENMTKNMQLKQLEIFKEFKRVCKKNSIPYCLAYGTCLGAVRHKGFIPWDDDIDVFMLYEDFVRFNELGNEFRQPYFLQTSKTDTEYGLMITRIRNSNTTLIENGEIDRDINHGVFIDVYPLYYCPNNYLVQKALFIISFLYRLLLYGKPPKNHGKTLAFLSLIILRLLSGRARKKMINILHSYMVSFNEGSCVIGLNAQSMKKTFAYKTNWFFPTIEWEFEGMNLPIPNNYDKVLKKTYGDYMKLPGEEKRTIHHNFAHVDFINSYKLYKGKYYCRNDEF